MSARQLLDAIKQLSIDEELRDKIKSYEETIRQLLELLEDLSRRNQRDEERVNQLFKKMRCPTCTLYLESKQPGDTIEVHECQKVFLTRCWGTEP